MIIPDNTFFANQWGLFLIKVPQAWVLLNKVTPNNPQPDIITENSDNSTFGNSDIRVGVIDSGIETENNFLIFAFDLNGRSTGLLGHIDAIGNYLAVLYRAGVRPSIEPRDKTTLNHEAMHGYGLYHTHQEEGNAPGALITIVEPEKKYTYYDARDLSVPILPLATDNVMSYNPNAVTLWQWQRKFIKTE